MALEERIRISGLIRPESLVEVEFTAKLDD